MLPPLELLPHLVGMVDAHDHHVALARVVEGVASAPADASRVGPVTTILDELEATHHALDHAGDGDVVVVCVDHANQVWKELQRRQHGDSSDSDGLRAVVGVMDADEEIDIET